MGVEDTSSPVKSGRGRTCILSVKCLKTTGDIYPEPRTLSFYLNMKPSRSVYKNQHHWQS